MLHGYGASKADLLDIAAGLHATGSFHLLMLDFRAHGDSEGRQVSFGLQEVLDVEAALAWLESRPDCCSLPVGCFGVSMGGAVSIAAAVRFQALRAVVVDSVYADLSKTIARSQWLTYHIPRAPLGQICLWGTELRLGCRLRQLSPVQVAPHLAPKPLLVIHGQDDVGVPIEEGKAVYEAAKGSKEFWMIPGAAHACCYYVAREEYPRRITEFFRHAFV